MDSQVFFEDSLALEKLRNADHDIVGKVVAPISEPLLGEIISDAGILIKALDRRFNQPISLLGEQLVLQGLITHEQLEKAIRIQSSSHGMRIGEILVEAGAVDGEAIDAVLATKLGVPKVDLRRLQIAPEALKLVPNLVARRLVLMPCFLHRGHVVVAMKNPLDHESVHQLRFTTNRHILPVSADREDIEWAIDRYYRELRLQEV